MIKEINRDKIDILKALAIFAVITIHTISQTFQFYSPQSFSWYLVLLADHIIRFSVPLFIALSGFTLANKYKDQEINYKEFLKRRVFKLLPLYIFWSLFIYIYLKNFGYLSQEGVGSTWWQLIFLGRTDYHLYFVPMILQLYLLFPILIILVNKFKLYFILPLFLFQLGFYYLIGTHTEKIPSDLFWTDQNTYVLSIGWIFYFCFGIYLVKYLSVAKSHKYLSAFVAISGLLWLFINSLDLLDKGINLIVVTRFTQIPVLIYSTGFIALTIIWGERLAKFPKFIHEQLVRVGRESYLVYLIHTMLIRLLFDVVVIPFRESVVVFTITIIVTTVICVRLWYFMVKKIPLMRYLE